MSYVLVKRITIDKQDVAVAPSCWIEEDEKGTSYVFFPKTVSMQTVDTLLERHTKPTAEWGKHECEILKKNIPSLSDAYSAIESMFSSRKKGHDEAHNSSEISTVCPQMVVVEEELINAPLSDRDQDYDPFADIPTLPVPEHVPDCLSTTGGHVMTVKVCDSTDPMQQLLNSVTMKSMPHLLNSFEKRQPMENAEKYRLTSVENVKRFETQLNEPGFRRELHDWVQCAVKHEKDPNKQMERLLELLFDEQLMKRFSWVGSKKRTALRDCCNIINLFKYAGTSAVHRVDDVEVRMFLYKHTLKR